MSTAMVLIALGVACVGLSAWMVYLQLPREDRPAPAWMKTESGEVAASLGCFMLLVAGIAMIIKGVP
jgi:hypothetical protein